MSSTAVSDPQISVHDFSDRLLGNDVYFHVIKLCNSFQVFIGIKPVLSNLAVAMQTKYVSEMPSVAVDVYENNVSSTHCENAESIKE